MHLQVKKLNLDTGRGKLLAPPGNVFSKNKFPQQKRGGGQGGGCYAFDCTPRTTGSLIFIFMANLECVITSWSGRFHGFSLRDYS